MMVPKESKLCQVMPEEERKCLSKEEREVFLSGSYSLKCSDKP